jgi:hypothetical protein
VGCENWTWSSFLQLIRPELNRDSTFVCAAI